MYIASSGVATMSKAVIFTFYYLYKYEYILGL